jgi:hypothetical protein
MFEALSPPDDLPGFRRRFVVTPRDGCVRAALEDDYHCMSVVVHHACGIAISLEPAIHRAPWSTCPGAEARLRQTFTGAALNEFAARGEKQTNCTHLHDLATLAAAHAGDKEPLVYDIAVSDPVDGRNHTALRRNGVTVLSWTLAGFMIVEPAEAAGLHLMKLGPLLSRLDQAGQEAVRVLRWGTIIAHGRSIPLENQSDATRMPPNCYTFQPEMAARAKRVGIIRDFSHGGAEPLDDHGQ